MSGEEAIETAKEAIFVSDNDRERREVGSLQARVRLLQKTLEATKAKESQPGTTTKPNN